MSPVVHPPGPQGRLQVLQKAFHAYARWLVSISWKRFFLLALLLMICAGILSGLAPFSWEFGDAHPSEKHSQTPKASPSLPPAPGVSVESDDGVTISIDERGVRVQRKGASADTPAPVSGSGAAAPVTGPASSTQSSETPAADPGGTKAVPTVPSASLPPPEPNSEDDFEVKVFDGREPSSVGDILTDLSALFIFASMILKLVYKGQMQAEAVATQAHAQAEAEQLRRQLAEARVATIQAQIEPHFLFNTLASIEHLIQSDPPRARRMQQHLIALLRASMPDLREAVERPLRPLARELDMVQPYLEIQKIRMEERLEVQLDIPEGLLSAEFPPLMLQTLVENAIRHGLEPQPSGGTLEVRAEVRDGQLIVHVIDNGAGLHAFHAATAPQKGTGLDNVRERLRLHYGVLAGLDLQNRPGGGTHARLHLPYRVASLSHESVRT